MSGVRLTIVNCSLGNCQQYTWQLPVVLLASNSQKWPFRASVDLRTRDVGLEGRIFSVTETGFSLNWMFSLKTMSKIWMSSATASQSSSYCSLEISRWEVLLQKFLNGNNFFNMLLNLLNVENLKIFWILDLVVGYSSYTQRQDKEFRKSKERNNLI